MLSFINRYIFLLVILIHTNSNNSIFSQINSTPAKNNSTSANNLISKQGGICFRTDDNTSSQHFYDLAEIFDRYNSQNNSNYHFSLALNLGASEFNSASYRDSIKGLQTMGHEIMDHTPNHRTNFFTTIFDTADYVSQSGPNPIPGVDHNVGNKICLEYEPTDINKAIRTGTCDINVDTVLGSFGSYDFFNEIYLYFPAPLDTLVFIADTMSNSNEIIFKDKWEDPIDLGIHTNLTYYQFTRSDINLTADGIKVLANETQKLATFYGLGLVQPLITWIQPGGRHPVFSMAELSEALSGDLGYTSGASFGEVQSLKVFNEYDPNDVKEFGMQWEDFNEDHEEQNLNDLKTQISDGIAKHKMLIGHNHFYTLTGSNGFETLEGYFEKVDSILSWCNTNNIPVRTYSEWTDILYNQTPDPYQNFFPPINVNNDNFTDGLNPNGVPDGYYKRTHSTHGIWETDPGAPSPGNYCYTVTNWARIFLVQNLAGIEKGENEFEIWTKGGENDKIRVIFTFLNSSLSPIEFLIPADSSEWVKYNLSQSLNGNNTLSVPDSVSEMSVEIKGQNFTGPIKVSGMYLAKKKPIINANLKVILEGPYDETVHEMKINSSFKNSIPLSQPFNVEPWNYDGEESTTVLPNDVIDWVLIELRETITADSKIVQKAAFVNDENTVINADGTPFNIQVIPGDYYIVIYHRNHLSIMSATKVPFNNN